MKQSVSPAVVIIVIVVVLAIAGIFYVKSGSGGGVDEKAKEAAARVVLPSRPAQGAPSTAASPAAPVAVTK
jgi:ABC-type cobalt transport system substrate-binding protein